jgi:hypothetical protein
VTVHLDSFNDPTQHDATLSYNHFNYSDMKLGISNIFAARLKEHYMAARKGARKFYKMMAVPTFIIIHRTVPGNSVTGHVRHQTIR